MRCNRNTILLVIGFLTVMGSGFLAGCPTWIAHTSRALGGVLLLLTSLPRVFPKLRPWLARKNMATSPFSMARRPFVHKKPDHERGSS